MCRDRVCQTPPPPFDAERCAEEPTFEGCPCRGEAPTTCYSGARDTLGVGACREGTRVCAEGVWGACDDEVLARSERCDGQDDDCDGEADEGVLNRCGTCTPCDRSEVRPGEWSPAADATGIVVAPDGSLTLSSDMVSAPYLWVANDTEQTVSKLRIDDGVEEGRYVSAATQAVSNRPSRTSVDLLGDAYVVNRAFGGQGSIVKFAATLDRCVDRDGNGMIRTARDVDGDDEVGAGEVLPWGRDECVLWTAEVGPFDAWPRAIAIGPGDDRSPQGYVWVGTFYQGRAAGTGRVYKLAATTGTLVAPPIELPPDFHPYGAAVDCRGLLWLQNGGTGELAAVDTATNELVVGAGAPDGRIGRPSGPSGCRRGYGVTVDGDGRIWSAGNECEDAWRFSPGIEDPTAGNWERVDLGGRGRVIGIATDLEERVWVSHFRTFEEGGGAISAIDASRAPMLPGRVIPLVDAAGRGVERPMGVGIDSLGSVWAIGRHDNCVSSAGEATGCAVRFNPDTREVSQHPVGKGPYTYSDFLGFVARNFSARRGFYRQRIPICMEDVGNWGELDLDAETPSGSDIYVRVRAASSASELDAARFTSWRQWVGEPLALEAWLRSVGQEQGWLLEIELRLEQGLGARPDGARCAPPGNPPRVRALKVFADCQTELL